MLSAVCGGWVLDHKRDANGMLHPAATLGHAGLRYSKEEPNPAISCFTTVAALINFTYEVVISHM